MNLAQALRDLIARYEYDGIPNDSLPTVQAARAALDAYDWQPIETVPDTDIVLLWDGVEVEQAPFDEDSPVQPTHWMPLPDGPAS